ncbi:MAG: class I SAM-dependent methyltransferase [Acaryochloridaceae cyanobacterium SU_2_1]|nr:class I SAM-dependent methyltransferase [Acaryochloridaceae cyanobacterium SU_2_1]
MTSDLLAAKADLFDRWAPNYDCLLTTVFYQALHQRLLDYVQLPRDFPTSVLDIGCGTGKLLNRLADHFPQLQGTGLDLAQQMLYQARQANRHHPRLIFIQGRSDALPFAQQQFEAAFSTISFLHYPEPECVLQEICRILKPGGQFYWVDYIPLLSCNSPQTWGIGRGKIHFYSQQRRARLATDARLSCLSHQVLLGPIMLTILAKP